MIYFKQLFILIFIFVCAPLASSGAESCYSIFHADSSQIEPTEIGDFSLKPYATNEKIKIIEFIRSTRAHLGVNPDFSADFRYLYSDLENPKNDYARDKGSFLVITNSNGEVLGTGGFTKINELICEVKKFYLHPSLRGKGLGKILLNTLILQAEKLGFKKIVLQTNPVMDSAIALYKKLGFKQILSSDKIASSEAIYFEFDINGLNEETK